MACLREFLFQASDHMIALLALILIGILITLQSTRTAEDDPGEDDEEEVPR